MSDGPTRRRVCARGAALALLLGAAPLAGARAAPDAEPWPRWQAHDPRSERRVAHGAWTAFLARHIERGADGINRVAYADVDAAGRRRLDDYVESLAAVPVDGLTRPRQMAYWINLYNALTVQVVLRHYPVESIRDIDISPGLFANGPWGAELVEVAGQALSLDDIEHRILRPIWRDPRIHYAVNCAALGCPDLRAEAYLADRLDTQLDDAARTFVNHRRGARIVDGRLIVSSLYDWYAEDFGGGDGAIIDHLRRYARPPLAVALATVRRIAGDDYDWRLNDT